MFGGNMPENDEWTLSLLTNSDYMEMHRSSFGAKQLYRDEKDGEGTIIWQSSGKECKYVAVFNTANEKREITAKLGEILEDGAVYSVWDIWNQTYEPEITRQLTVSVDAHGARLFKLIKK